MFQSNKEYIEFLRQSGVHTFLQETPNNFIQNKEIHKEIIENTDLKELDEVSKIEDLITIIENHNSDLKKMAKNIVLFDGNVNSRVIIIGDSPDKVDDIEGLPFVGEAGLLLNQMLSAIQLERKDIYITNAIPWIIPKNRAPTEEEILEFLPFLQRQIEIIKPKFIFLLGSTAVKAILSTPISLEKLRGKWHKYKSINMKTDIKVLVSYHPAFLLRSPNFKKGAWDDLQMLQEKINEN